MRAEKDTKQLDDKQVESAKQIALKLLTAEDTDPKDRQLAKAFLLSIGVDEKEIAEVESGGRKIARAFGQTRSAGIVRRGASLELGHMTPAQARAWLSERGTR
jgi:hypothetical protein